MRRKTTDRLAQAVLTLSFKLMPSDRSDWAEAMGREFEVAARDNTALQFALGCLIASLDAFVRTRFGLYWMGRLAIAGALMAIALYATMITVSGGHTREQATVILALCGFYLIGGILALYSVRLLRRYAVLGLIAAPIAITAAMGMGGLSHGAIPLLGSPISFFVAISIEFAGIMAAVLFSTLYLSALYTPDPEEGMEA